MRSARAASDAPDAQTGRVPPRAAPAAGSAAARARCADREAPRAGPDRAGTGARGRAPPARPRARPAPARARRPAPRGPPATSSAVVCARRFVMPSILGRKTSLTIAIRMPGLVGPSRCRLHSEASQRIGKRRFTFGKKPRSSADAAGASVSRAGDGSVWIAVGHSPLRRGVPVPGRGASRSPRVSCAPSAARPSAPARARDRAATAPARATRRDTR